MANAEQTNEMSDSRISQFVEELRGIRNHYSNPEGWDDLRNGSYMGGQTESQIIKRGAGGLGLVSDRLSDEEWDEALHEIAAIHKQKELRDNLDSIEHERRDAHIDRLFAEGFGKERRLNKDWLRNTIDSYLAEDRFDDLELLLQDANGLGVDRARRKQTYGGKWTYVGYSLRVLAAILELFVAWWVILAASSTFEKSVICLLILIYARAAETRSELRYRFAHLFVELGKRFGQTYRLLRERPQNLWAADKWAFEVCNGLDKGAAHLLISSGKYSLLTLLAVVNLISATLFR